jgi:hypothetical protein
MVHAIMPSTVEIDPAVKRPDGPLLTCFIRCSARIEYLRQIVLAPELYLNRTFLF